MEMKFILVIAFILWLNRGIVSVADTWLLIRGYKEALDPNSKAFYKFTCLAVIIVAFSCFITYAMR